MPLADGQVQVRGLVMGPGTDYELADFDPWSRQTRAEQAGPRAWNDGSWSGAEWAAEATVPMRIRVRNLADGTPGGWVAAHHALAAAFAPSHDDLELRFGLGGVEYVMFGRPRLVELEVDTIRRGWSVTRAAFVGLDPAVYSGVEHTQVLGLPSTSGGLTVPVTAPFTIPATVTAGRATITNAGTSDVGLRLRIDGPVQEPRVSLLTPAGTAIVRVWLTLTAGQWLDIDTAARTVYLNGVASRRGLTTAEGTGWPVLPTGAHEIAFDSPVYDASAQLSVFWRDAWH